jgi:uncharacterized protein (TIGR03382 family)
MAKNVLTLLTCAVICLGATNASAGGFFSFWNSFFDNYSYDSKYDHDFNYDYDRDRACNAVPEPSGALLFAAGGLVFAAVQRRNRRK